MDLRTASPPHAEVVTANLTTRLLDLVAQRWAEAGAPPATAIASGFLAGEADDVARSLTAAGMVERRRLTSGGWGALLARS
jgi:ribosomal protein L11 methylase PrmA